mmetsp:Transcript_5547/g.4742  ORF Transcript_5547/g.4742 Transcript_5547/m.4742 type:complete len:154 (-) Transcript_5547:781-1242(-)
MNEIGPWCDYIGRVYFSNSEKTSECHTLVVENLLNLSKYTTSIEKVHTIEVNAKELMSIKPSKISGLITSIFPDKIRESAKVLNIIMKNGFKDWEISLAKLHQAFPNLSIICFKGNASTNHILSNKLKEYESLWYNINFGIETESDGKFTLFD